MEMFKATRTKKPGRVYKQSEEATNSKIAEMENIQAQARASNNTVDAFSQAMGKEHSGRLRLYGRGVNPTAIKGKNIVEDSVKVPADFMRSIQQNVENEMQKKLEVEVQKKVDAQRSEMAQEIFTMIVSGLQQLNPGLNINTNMSAIFFPGASSPGDALSAPGHHNQPRNHPSSAGVHNPQGDNGHDDNIES